jgi:nicotinamidase-related amidase
LVFEGKPLHPNILQPNQTALIVVDVQEAFRHVIPEFETVAVKISTAVRGFQTLGVPVMVTEQYPKGLGHTAEEIKLVLPDDAEIFEKSAFSSCGAGSFAARLDEMSIKQTVICGLETHICVNQTAHDLLDRGIQVHLLTDAVCSRFEDNKAAGLAKMQASGVIASSVEMSLFELMRDAKHEKFKEIQALIK